jgi:hypothetical protein
MKTTTSRFAKLLADARAWDARYIEMGHAQTEWMLENFAFSDNLCVYVSPIDRQRWDVPRVVDGRLFTVCETTR